MQRYMYVEVYVQLFSPIARYSPTSRVCSWRKGLPAGECHSRYSLGQSEISVDGIFGNEAIARCRFLAYDKHSRLFEEHWRRTFPTAYMEIHASEASAVIEKTATYQFSNTWGTSSKIYSERKKYTYGFPNLSWFLETKLIGGGLRTEAINWPQALGLGPSF